MCLARDHDGKFVTRQKTSAAAAAAEAVVPKVYFDILTFFR